MGRAIHSAHELLATNERELYDLSQSEAALDNLSPAQRRLHLQRARDMRDRARALYRKQVGHTLHHTSTKRGFTGMANERTRQKAQLLSEVVRKLAGEAA